MERRPECIFQSLPLDLCQSFLIQAFKQLDQQHLLCIIPLVCKQWHQLSHDCCSCLDVEVRTAAAANSLILWVARHPSQLLKFSIRLLGELTQLVGSTLSSRPDDLLQSLAGASQLRELRLGGEYLSATGGQFAGVTLNLPFSSFTALTTLALVGVWIHPSCRGALPQLTQLRSLTIIRCQLPSDMAFPVSRDFIPAMAKGLTGLTCLDLAGSVAERDADFSPLTSLLGLVELRLEGAEQNAIHVARHLPCSLPVKGTKVILPALLPSWGIEQRAAFIGGWLQPLLMEHLQMLDLEGSMSRFDEQQQLPGLFAALGRSGPQLQSLSLANLNAHEAISKLSHLTKLTQLRLSFCGLGDSDVPHIAALTGLRALSLADYVVGLEVSADSAGMLAASLQQLTRLVCSANADAAVRQAFQGRIIEPCMPCAPGKLLYTLAVATT